jgi:hypothetical protein
MSSRRSSQHEGPLPSGHAQTCCLARDVHGLSPVLRPAHAKNSCGLVPQSQVSSIVAWMCAPLLSYGSQIQQCVVHYIYAFGLLNLRWLNTAEMYFCLQGCLATSNASAAGDDEVPLQRYQPCPARVFVMQELRFLALPSFLLHFPPCVRPQPAPRAGGRGHCPSGLPSICHFFCHCRPSGFYPCVAQAEP